LKAMQSEAGGQTSNLLDPAVVAAVVVTYNRSKLLVDCLDHLLKQSRPVDRIIVVDNGSTDGTCEILNQKGFLANPVLDYLSLGKNYGNSGGLFRGISHALNEKPDWIWVMDDDANPDGYALQRILENDVLQKNIYGSAAIGSGKSIKKLCFPAKTVNRLKNKYIEHHEELNDIEEVEWIPFLGFFIHSEMIRRIGLPDPDLFILNDDVEYSERAKKCGANIYIVKSSIIYHPYQQTVSLNILGRKVYYRSMPPWKAYYGARNKVIVAKKYYGKLLWLQTIPGIFFRSLLGFLYEPKCFSFFFAHIIGIYDGLRGNKGVRFMPEITTSPPTHKTNDS